MIEAIIFDFDGVLFDSEPLHLAACNQVFAQLGFNLAPEIYCKHYIGLSDAEMFPLVLASQGITLPEEALGSLLKQKFTAYENIIHSSANLKSVDGALTFLKHLSPSIKKLAICSGATRSELLTTLNKIEDGKLVPYFELIITKENVTLGKPSPEGYLKTAMQLGTLPQNCLVIEDTLNGIKAAKAADMKVVALTTTHHASELQQADFVAENYHEIQRWFANV